MIVSLLIGILVVCLLYLGHKHNEADWGHWATNILDGLIRIYCRQFHRQKSQKIIIPEAPQVILACNHISGIDPFILITATNRPIRFMIAVEEYNKPLLKWMFRAAGCIPVDRSGRVEKAFRSALRAIQTGELVALFPQGGIHHSTTPREIIKPGIIKLSQLSLSYILPVRIHGVGAPGTVAGSVLTRSHISIEQHDLISPEQALASNFRLAMSNWLLAKSNKIE
ncbi:lysophospholipid acyltransferase family protein [Aliikangiella sp. IMCC44359]|uniref:lysophospholipid acyltransferase family protein n=1 Tax=Aliikangiella sp. IMCC44359 TaxID=3459125 RepID=UPI00403B0E23